MLDRLLVVLALLGIVNATLNTTKYTWKPLKTGAGGWVVGLNIHPSGEPFFARTDVAGAYRYEESTKSWKQLVTTDSISADDYDDIIFTYTGVLSLVSAPSDSSRAYMAYNNDLYRSDYKGDSWTRLYLANLTFDANANYRLQGERIAVSPSDADILYFGSPQGLRYSSDAGETWSMIDLSGLGISGDYAVGNVLFASDTITYFTSDNNGVFGTSNGGTTWNRLNQGTGAPPTASYYSHIAVDSTGALYVADTTLWKYSQGTWTNLNSPVQPAAFAIQPGNDSVIIVLDGNGGHPYVSSNGGATWKNPVTVTRTATDIPWLGWTSEDWMSVGNIAFHPQQPSQLWFSEGIGMWRTEDIFADPFNWISVNTKIEELVGNDIVVPPGGQPVTGHWDRAIFYHEDIDVYPETHAPTNRFNSAWDLDYSANTPTFLVASVSDHRFCCGWDGLQTQSGYSEDGGKTWTLFGSIAGNTHPSDLWFGDIAVAANDINNIVWLPTFNAPAYYSTDKGDSWNMIFLPDLNGATNGSHSAYYLNRRVLTADRVLDNTFYLYHTDRGVYRSTTGGASWQLRSSSGLPLGWPAGYYNVIMESVPGYEGHLFWAPGSHSVDYGFFRSTDGGDTWVRCNDSNLVHSFGFGKPAHKNGYPRIFVQGIINGTKGLFYSDDACSSWTAIDAPFPLGMWSYANGIAGDMKKSGRVYINFSGAGAVYGDIESTDGGNNVKAPLMLAAVLMAIASVF